MNHFLTLLAVLSSLTFSQEKALEFIKTNDIKLQELLKSQIKQDTPEVQSQLDSLVDEIFDFKELGKRALGEELSKKHEVKLPEFQEAFQALLKKRFIQSVKGRIADSTEYRKPKLKKGVIKVKTYVFSHGKKTKVSYKLLDGQESFKVFDLLTGSSSTLKTYRSMFKTLLEKKSFQEVIDLLIKKTTDK